MAKRGGFPGGGMPGNMANLMKQAQRMQRQMEEQQKELEAKEFTAAAGGGAVEVTVSGKREVLKVKLAEEVVDPEDIEMLEDLIVAATNEAIRKVDEETGAAMSKLTGGLGGGMPDKEIVITSPSINVMTMKGQRSFQIDGESFERPLGSAPSEQGPGFPEDDITMVMEQAGCDREKAVEALSSCDGNIAEAIVKLMG